MPRWLPLDRNPADALTKFRGAHVEPLIRMFKTGKFHLKSETVELERKKQANLTFKQADEAIRCKVFWLRVRLLAFVVFYTAEFLKWSGGCDCFANDDSC